MDIQFRQLEKWFGTLQALKPLSMTIQSGEFVSLVGPSGCGKTTLLRMIAGLEDPAAGSILFGGTPVFDSENHINKPPQKRKIGMVFQDFALWPHMTVFENVAYGLKATGRKREVKEKVAEALKSVQLDAHHERYPHQLSGGQQQRVAIARAIATDPEIILMDEPLSALDASLRDEMRILLQSLVKKLNMTAVYVTHDQSEAMAMSDRVVVMNAGDVQQTGTPEEIYQRPVNDTVASFIGKGTLLDGLVTEVEEVPMLKVSTEVQIPLSSKKTDGLKPHDWVHAIIRPEQVKLDTKPSEAGLAGIVETVSFLGERYEVSVKLHGCNERLFAYTHEKTAPGQEISLTVRNTIHLIQHKGGLTHEETA
ncbi:ABC transporter ATP-binding protein [Bacillus daqingensis]|uniref:ABC transporter ATP-binding protein n=1 Tax=Bacillus daqingensis TaxID=872396 RepID=A0ABV9P0Q4_9BACI